MKIVKKSSPGKDLDLAKARLISSSHVARSDGDSGGSPRIYGRLDRVLNVFVRHVSTGARPATKKEARSTTTMLDGA